jgi:hypothetical protein
VDFLPCDFIVADANCGSTEERANVVGLLDAFLRVPDDVVAIGKDGCTQGRTVVSAKSDHHESKKGYNVSNGVEERNNSRTQSFQPYDRS